MSPLGEMASPSHPSATGTLPVTRPEEVSMTETVGGRYPPLSTSKYFPSGESAVDMGRVSSAIWRPTGSRRHPLLSRDLTPGSGPSCSRGGRLGGEEGGQREEGDGQGDAILQRTWKESHGHLSL